MVGAAGPEVRFVGGIYDPAATAALRFHSLGYVHGHTVGGTWRAYGPGICDMKGGTLLALEAIRELARAGHAVTASGGGSARRRAAHR